MSHVLGQIVQVGVIFAVQPDMGDRRPSERVYPVVLVVESDRSELDRLTAILRKEGYEVLEAESFHDAVRSMQSAPTQVLVTTVRLGPYNGLHLIARCRMARPDVVAILTHHEEDRLLRQEAVSQRAAFLLKPCAPETLTHAVRTSLGRA